VPQLPRGDVFAEGVAELHGLRRRLLPGFGRRDGVHVVPGGHVPRRRGRGCRRGGLLRRRGRRGRAVSRRPERLRGLRQRPHVHRHRVVVGRGRDVQ
jgi:hypothetical protein